MKKYGYIAMMVICTLLIGTACGDDDDDVTADEAWTLENDEAFAKIAADPSYKEIKSEGNDGSVYYKVLKEGDGKEPIYYNSTIKAYYTGSLIRDYDGSVVDGADFNVVEPPYDTPATFSINGTIAGWGIAVPWMKVGDRWEIWIPQQLAYGASGSLDASKNVVIPPYSTLKFEIEVVEIVQQ